MSGVVYKSCKMQDKMQEMMEQIEEGSYFFRFDVTEEVSRIVADDPRSCSRFHMHGMNLTFCTQLSDLGRQLAFSCSLLDAGTLDNSSRHEGRGGVSANGEAAASLFVVPSDLLWDPLWGSSRRRRPDTLNCNTVPLNPPVG